MGVQVGLGDKYLARERKGKQRKVWDLGQTGDYTRADLKGQDFDDWILSTADRVCAAVSNFSGTDR